MWRVLVLVVACSHAAPPPKSPPPPPPPSKPRKTQAEIDACKQDCNMIVMSRHDACGRNGGPPWPDWCADDNERMFDHCEASCFQ